MDNRNFFRGIFELEPEYKLDSGLLTDDELERYYAEHCSEDDASELELGVM